MPAQEFDWNDLKLLTTLHQAGSLSATAQQLQVDVSTISRRLAAAEQRLHSTLFIRTPNGYQATELGLAFMQQAQPITQQVQQLLESTQQQAQAVQGTVRITAVDFIFSSWLGRELAAFQQQHPQLCLELINADRDLSFSHSETDLAIRFARPQQDAALFMRKVGELGLAIYAAPQFADLTPQQWAAQPWLSYTQALAHVPEMRWLAQHYPKASICLKSCHLPTLLQACQQGLGLALLPCMLAEQAGLKRLSPMPVLQREIWLLSHRQIGQIQRFETVYRWLLQLFADYAAQLRGTPLSVVD